MCLESEEGVAIVTRKKNSFVNGQPIIDLVCHDICFAEAKQYARVLISCKMLVLEELCKSAFWSVIEVCV